MSLAEHRASLASRRWRGGRLVIAAAAIVFAGLALAGALPYPYALAGFAFVAAAAVLAVRTGEEEERRAPIAISERGDDLLRPSLPVCPIPSLRSIATGACSRSTSGRGLWRRLCARASRYPLRSGCRNSSKPSAAPPPRAKSSASSISSACRSTAGSKPSSCRSSAAPNATRPDLVLMTFHDLTPLRRVEEMRADFVANASHELRTPLAALLGFIETLQGSAREDAKARERFLAIMQEQARRMARLIDDLLSLSRIELNAHRRPDTPADLVPIVRQVADGLETLARDRGVTLHIEAGNALAVHGDHDELVRVFENLVENALKYGAAGRRVDIKLATGASNDGEPEALVSVRDYGPGIAPEHLPRLTERFYRVDVGESRAQGGTGLGLALVKHILNRHRGRLTIDSAPGAGATFTVHLPTAVPAHPR